jgi:hypothetical protein
MADTLTLFVGGSPGNVKRLPSTLATGFFKPFIS